MLEKEAEEEGAMNFSAVIVVSTFRGVKVRFRKILLHIPLSLGQTLLEGRAWVS